MIHGRKLTSTDFLILALERYNTSTGTAGNTCRYVLELDGQLNVSEFEESLNHNEDLKILSSLKIKTSWFSVPKWEVGDYTNKRFKVNLWESEDLIPKEVHQLRLSVEESKVFSFDVVKKKNGNSTLIFSWHHLVMDGYGAILLLKELTKKQSVINQYKYQEPDIKIKRHILKRTVLLFFKNAKLSVKGLFKPSLQGINRNPSISNLTSRVKIIPFTREETAGIDKNALRLGARFGRSPFYLAVAARIVMKVLKDRGIVHDRFWIPVPQDRRKKGANGPLIGNHLAFLFYELKMEVLESLSKTVKELNDQMVDQLRKETPTVYESLMRSLRRIPLFIFYQFVKGPKGGSLASFLFTVAANHPDDLMEIQQCKIVNALSFPPNTYPPGVTFAFMQFQERLQLMVLYYDEVLSLEEMQLLEETVRYELIHGEER